MNANSQASNFQGNVDSVTFKKMVSRASMAAICVAFFLILIKLVVVVLSNSISLYASLMDSVFDLLCSFLNFMVLKQALKPADDNHSFGHGKYEYFGIIVQSVFIGTSSIFLFISSINRFKNPMPIENGAISLVILAISIVVTFALIAYQARIIKITNSQMIKVDRTHYQMDLFMNSAVAVAVACSYFGYVAVDNILAIVISLYMFYSVLGMLKTAFLGLTDVSLPDEELALINKIAAQHPQVLGIHDLRTRQASNTKYVQFHVEMSDSATLKEAHDICDELETAIQNAFPDIHLIIHPEPSSVVALEKTGEYQAKVNHDLIEAIRNPETKD